MDTAAYSMIVPVHTLAHTKRSIHLRVILPRINLTCQVFREECFDSAMSDFYTDLIVRSRGTKLVPLLLTIRSVRLAHTAGHLQLDQAVQLNRVLHREFLGDRLDEAVDDQRGGLGLIQATAHQVEELVVTDLRDGRLVADFGLVLFDANGWIGIGASILIEQERITADMGLGVVRTPVDADQAAIRGSTSPLGDRLRENLGSGVRSKARDLGSSIQLHPIAGEGH